MPSYFKKTHVTTYAEKKIKQAYRAAHQVCEACGVEKSDQAHHIVTEGSGGVTEDWNLLALCVFCHVPIFHGKGYKYAIDKFPHLAQKIVTARIKMGRKV